jgi:LmbE family N-acetylglucosaminyl deacetylase
VLAVVAHPDDESFGLGAVLGELADRGAELSLVCFTHGEASTLGRGPSDLRERRADELACACAALGVNRLTFGDYPDGHLDDVPLTILVDEVAAAASARRPDLLLVFDEGGITGHPDHRRATHAAIQAAQVLELPVLAWCLPDAVATALHAQFGTDFVGRPPTDIDVEIEVERARQRQAIRCHASQSTDNPVLARRLALQGNREVLHWIRPQS